MAAKNTSILHDVYEKALKESWNVNIDFKDELVFPDVVAKW